MAVIIGSLIVILSVFGGFVLSHGQLLSLWQPFELLIIGGAALGAFIIANPSKVVWAVFKQAPKLFAGAHYSKKQYMQLLAVLFALFNKVRREGLMTIEDDIESPKQSEIFRKFPSVLKNTQAIDFICDYMRILVIGDMSAYEMENLMDVELETIHHEEAQPAMALQKVADALPGFGIVAAVLGIVITMQSLGGPAEEIGTHVAAALVGTFLGILLAYGFVAPTSLALEHKAKEEIIFLECIKAAIIATVNGVPPQIAIEFGRKTIPPSERPSYRELEAFSRKHRK